MVHGSGPVLSLEMDWNGNRPSIGPIGLVSLSDRLVQLSHVDRRLIRLQNAIRLTLSGDRILTMTIESTKGTLPPVLAEGIWLKPTTFDSGEPYLGFILSNRRVREVNRRMSSWPAFRTRHASYLFAHLIVCVYRTSLLACLMGSSVIYYEYEKRETFEDHDMRADAELGTFKIRRYHFDNGLSFILSMRSIRP
ncbi:hypothetical protein PIB30_100085 [Stylosanthes scabra]|uniref:Uncharacterized protein n=1 Tax=Stylosanthes scabra TaxID=79078 RepID=A0ABU6RX05_9FABA|nr:hypothetical protein [Stylosanthes scabra]